MAEFIQSINVSIGGCSPHKNVMAVDRHHAHATSLGSSVDVAVLRANLAGTIVMFGYPGLA